MTGQREQGGSDPPVGSDRVLAVLAELARHPAGIGLDDLARRLHSPKPTIHRALAALRRAGFAAQQRRGPYLLGDEFLRLAFAHHEARPDHVRIRPVLEQLVARHHEVGHYAVLEDRWVIYRSKVDPSAGTVQLTSTIGGRNPAHSTAVGKLLLSFELTDRDAVARWVSAGPLEARTARTKLTAQQLWAEFCVIRSQGYATENEENETGVACLAIPVFMDSGARPSGAVSISSLIYRTPLQSLVDDLPALRLIIAGGTGADLVAQESKSTVTASETGSA